MCRFLLVRSEKPINPQPLLQEFAAMCKKSRAPDGDWQGDGYGIAWNQDDKWQLHKSIEPIWKETETFKTVGGTNLFVAHARSAGFPQQKGVIDYNQPYINDTLCFVFNGMIRGVKLPFALEGKIGAQKLFSLIKNLLQKETPETVLKKVDKLLRNNTTKIVGMNIGLVQNGAFYVLCDYADNDDYFGVRYIKDNNLTLVCSAPFGAYHWKSMKKGEIRKI